jgi:hypothetical protein
VPLAGLEPAHRASETRVTSTYRGGAPRRASGGNRNRFLRVSSTAPLPRHREGTERAKHRAGIEPALRALQARALPLGDRCAFRCEDSNLDRWSQRPASYRWTTPDRSRHSGSNRARSHTRRAGRATVTLTALVERTGIEPAAAALQVQLAPVEHASPIEPDQQGVRRESNPILREPHSRVRPLHYAHHEERAP